MSNQVLKIEFAMSYDDYLELIAEYPKQGDIMRLWPQIEDDSYLTEFEREALHAEMYARRRRALQTRQ
jgi:hypothetical protein